MAKASKGKSSRKGADFSELDKALKRYGRIIEAGVNNLKRDVSLAVLNSVVEETPVDTGKARSNWQVGLNSNDAAPRGPYAPIPSQYRPPYQPGPQRSERSNLQAAIAAGQGTISGANLKQAIYISNSLPYIGRLDDGYSKQTDAGFVSRAVQAGVSVAKNYKVLKNGGKN